MNDRQHIPEEVFQEFVQDRMKHDQTKEFLAHISSCNHCADRLETYLAGAMLPAPKSLKDNILLAIRRPEVQLAVKAKETSKQMQLFVYGLKVGTATIAALLMLLLTMNSSLLSNLQQTQPDQSGHYEDNIVTEEHFSLSDTLRDNMYKLSDSMLDFSNNIIHKEVTKHDKKEK